MSADRVLRDDTLITKIVEKVLKSDILPDKISKVIGEKTAEILKMYHEKSNTPDEPTYGIPETANDNTDNVISAICKDKLGVDVHQGTIDCSHRLGKSENGSRPILVKFCSRNIKQMIFNNKRKLKGSKIIIREDLTKRCADWTC
ncbi:hypothetical protein QE152_g25238 [Popillia japonica]|uniref:Uncharacterized protein n=1 Tax=Popillia japonica TaxID=7064 RepID=A0AAW1K2L4_POPJA